MSVKKSGTLAFQVLVAFETPHLERNYSVVVRGEVLLPNSYFTGPCYFQVAEDRAEFESNTSLRKQQNNFIRNAGFTKRLELGRQMYLT